MAHMDSAARVSSLWQRRQKPPGGTLPPATASRCGHSRHAGVTRLPRWAWAYGLGNANPVITAVVAYAGGAVAARTDGTARKALGNKA
jgi:hypothetical protein